MILFFRLPEQVTFSSLLNGDNDAVEEQMICDFEFTTPKYVPMHLFNEKLFFYYFILYKKIMF